MDIDSALPSSSPHRLPLSSHLPTNGLASTVISRHHSHSVSPDRRHKKSSSTCTTCRARKVRCNGARAICSNCQRLGFPCSYDDSDVGAWTAALPRRRVKQACVSCHSRKARCSGHLPSCERCRTQGLDCVYRPSKRAKVSSLRGSGDGTSPQSHDDDRDDYHHDSDPSLTDFAHGEQGNNSYVA